MEPQVGGRQYSWQLLILIWRGLRLTVSYAEAVLPDVNDTTGVDHVQNRNCQVVIGGQRLWLQCNGGAGLRLLRVH